MPTRSLMTPAEGQVEKGATSSQSLLKSAMIATGEAGGDDENTQGGIDRDKTQWQI